MAREAAHVHLVDDRARRGPVQRRVAFPVVGGRIDDHALHGGRGIVARPAAASRRVAFRDDNAAAVRIEQHLGGIESQPAVGSHGPVDAIPVDLSRLERRARTRASSGRCGSRPDRARSRATAWRRLRDRRTASSTPVAVRENRLKLTPPSTTAAPGGELRPIFSGRAIYFLSPAGAHSSKQPVAVGIKMVELGHGDSLGEKAASQRSQEVPTSGPSQ